MARIEVRFLIDANGILNVTARDLRTGKEQSVDVKPSYGLTDEQVEKMILESFEKAEEDFKERQVREARVEADAILAAVEKARQHDAYFELTDEERAAIDRAVNELLLVYHADDHHADPREDRAAESGHHDAGGEHDEHGGRGRAEGNQDLMPKLTWDQHRRHRARAAREVPGPGPDAHPLHGPAQMDHGAGGLRRRSGEDRPKASSRRSRWRGWKSIKRASRLRVHSAGIGGGSHALAGIGGGSRALAGKANKHGTKELLAHVRIPRAGRRFRSAAVVGARCDDSDFCFQLVVCLSEWVVLGLSIRWPGLAGGCRFRSPGLAGWRILGFLND